jgi:hypothetical protein
MIWEKAQELYQMEQAKTMSDDFKGITATRKELREGGYFYQAKLIVLRNLWREKKVVRGVRFILSFKTVKSFGQWYATDYLGIVRARLLP